MCPLTETSLRPTAQVSMSACLHQNKDAHPIVVIVHFIPQGLLEIACCFNGGGEWLYVLSYAWQGEHCLSQVCTQPIIFILFVSPLQG